MKVTLNWLKQYVDFDWSSEQLSERLTMIGIEVEGVQKLGGEFEGVVVAQVLTRDKVPGSDKLSVCKVNDGKMERTIICGAPNHQPGDKVPLILPNFALPLKAGEKEPFVIKERKVFGITSQGMMCSPQELGLPDQVDGLLILPADAKVGQPFAEYLGRQAGDVVYDLEITPNRPDLNSVIGIAREISAVTGNPLKIPSVQGEQSRGVLVAAVDEALLAAAREVVGPARGLRCAINSESGDIRVFAKRLVSENLSSGTDVISIAEARRIKPEAQVGEELEVDITPVGFGRIASQQAKQALAQHINRAAGTEPGESLVSVQLQDPELCPRYVARVVRGVKVGPSPDWLKQTLEKVGIRSISNVVDVTNFVMLEIGQPLHAFDYHLLTAASGHGPTIVVRRAAEGEKFTTLDGQSRTLTPDALLIADETKAVALAGIMGGQNSEINERTVDVLIESAYFKPQNIRATSKKLELRTESSYRFERGADVGICDWASRRAAQLILQTAGGQLAGGVIDAYPHPAKPKEINLRHHKVCDLLGVRITPAQNVKHLRQLGLEVAIENADEYCLVVVPTFRVDLKREVDLIEEIGRLHGIDHIPSTPPRGAVGSHPYDEVHDQLAEARHLLTGLGLNEAQGQTLISASTAKLATPELVALQNPLSSDMDVLRPSLLPGLLDALHHNLNRKNCDVTLFEVGRVFNQVNGQRKEERRVAILITGLRHPSFWSGGEREAVLDVYDLKGLLEEFLEQFGLRGMNFARRPESTALFLESAAINLGKLALGEMGQLLPTLAKRYDARNAVLLAELNLDLLLARRNPSKTFKALPAFPSIRRDVAMLVPEATTHEAVASAVKQVKPQNLETLELFDVFRGKNIPEGQKSMAYAFTYRNADRTLTDAEVNAAHEKVVEKFKQDLRAEIR